jgi:hypothetical protein
MSDEPVLLGMGHLFNNRFMKAKKVFESEADTNPLFGFGLGYMAFLKGTSIASYRIEKARAKQLANVSHCISHDYSYYGNELNTVYHKYIDNRPLILTHLHSFRHSKKRK